MAFQKTIVIIAVVILLIVLVFIGIALSNNKYGEKWPPVVGDCPDYWVDMSGNGEACHNTKNLGKCNLSNEGEQGSMNFNQAPFNSSTGLCSKYKWAKGCQVTWDGITYGIPNPCDTTDDAEL